MLILIAVAALRSRGDSATGKPLTCAFTVGFPALGVAAALLYARMERRAGPA